MLQPNKNTCAKFDNSCRHEGWRHWQMTTIKNDVANRKLNRRQLFQTSTTACGPRLRFLLRSFLIGWNTFIYIHWKNPGRTGSGKNRRKPAQNCHFWLFFGVVRILGAADEISKNVLESPFQELSNNSSTVSVPLQEQNPGRRPGRAFLSPIFSQYNYILKVNF